MTESASHFSFYLNSMTIFGVTLLLGVIGGELAKKLTYLPQISGYILMGFLIGPGGFNILDHSILNISHLFVDISLSLILFSLGKQLDFSWLRNDPSLLLTSIFESGLTFSVSFILLYHFLSLSFLQATLASTIAIATSPAMIMMVTNDLSAEGPVTRRALILTSLNNLFALLIFTIILPFTQKGHGLAIGKISYILFGSTALGFLIFLLTKYCAVFIGKRKENQFVLMVSAVMLTLGLAYAFKFSSMLSLFMLGVMARNLDFNHDVMEVDFGWLARVFIILLFVMIGAHIHLSGFWNAPILVLALLLGRIFAKSFSMLLFFRACRLTVRQAYALSLTLLPMAGLAIGMSNMLMDWNPELGKSLEAVITATVTLLNIVGPILLQHAFMITGEALVSSEQLQETA